MTIDSNVLIALCAKETDKYAVAHRELTDLADAGYQFHAPGVVIAESLHILCRKLQDGDLTPESHSAAIARLADYMKTILPPPNGEGSLVARAEEIRASYGCSRSADGIFIALTEELGSTGIAELLTFDAKLQNQIKRNAPAVKVRLLVGSPSSSGTPAGQTPNVAP